MFEGLFQPMHLLVIVGLGLLMFGRENFQNSARGWAKGFAVAKLARF